MITYFWYIEDGLGNKINGLTILNEPISFDNYKRTEANLFDELKEKYPLFDRNTMIVKCLSRM